jgi:hypothetical protein
MTEIYRLNQITMASFGELKPNTYYLIQVDAESDIELVSVILETKETVLLRSYLPQTEDFFKHQEETIFKLIEEVDDETAAQFESLYQQTTEEVTEYEEDEEE